MSNKILKFDPSKSVKKERDAEELNNSVANLSDYHSRRPQKQSEFSEADALRSMIADGEVIVDILEQQIELTKKDIVKLKEALNSIENEGQ